MTTKKDLWNAQLYDGNHTFVSNYGNDLIGLLQPKTGEHILDVGCGTGDLTQKIHEAGAHVVGVDYSDNMIAQAKEKYPHLSFEVADAHSLTFHEQFDAVFSNAALHWMKTPDAVIHSIYNSLKPGGRFVAEFGGAHNVQLITDELIHQIRTAGIAFSDEQFPWYFPTIGAYSVLLEAAGFHVQLAHHYERPTPLVGQNGLTNWLEMFSPSLFENVPLTKKQAIFEATCSNLAPKLYQDGTWYADYKRLRIVAYKK